MPFPPSARSEPPASEQLQVCSSGFSRSALPPIPTGRIIMNDAQAEALTSLSALIDKIALELVFAQPASDAGLLPINSFITELEESAQTNPPSEPIRNAIAKSRELVDNVF